MFSEGEGLDVATGGTQSRFAREKPPISASDINLQDLTDSGSWKVVRINGAVGLLIASAFNAMFDNLLNSSRLRPMKPLAKLRETLIVASMDGR